MKINNLNNLLKMSGKNISNLNDVKNRFLLLPKSAVEGLEHEPKKSDFNFIKELGIGSFGTVYLVSHKKTKAIYALKAIDKSLPENIEQKANFNREVEIMYKLNHPNIVRLYGHFEDEKYCYLIMQYIPNKDLFELIPTNGRKPNIKLITSIMKGLIGAVYYLHNMKPTIIHRDIKPENILLDNNYNAYLTDFGWSNYMANSHIKRTTICGTLLYLPPEMIEQLGHDETVDIWCIGILLFELITGTTPFEGNDLKTVAHNITELKITWPPKMDPDAKDLVSKILKLKGKDRLPIEQILSHSFFCKYFPNAVNELIKPENQNNRTFIISKDVPKKCGEETKQAINRTETIERNPFGKAHNINNNTSIIETNNNCKSKNAINNNININNSYINNNPTKNNINNNHRNNDKNDNTQNNYNSNYINSKDNKQKVRATFIPKAIIDLTNSKNGKYNNDKKATYTSYNMNNSNKNRISSFHNKDNYNYKRALSFNNTEPNNNKFHIKKNITLTSSFNDCSDKSPFNISYNKKKISKKNTHIHHRLNIEQYSKANTHDGYNNDINNTNNLSKQINNIVIDTNKNYRRSQNKQNNHLIHFSSNTNSNK